ncbi:multiple sugar transport system ATP-binding protein [Actinoplanes lutulentus]|uniref:Carbohydrate ABC transporter ATP-binding protein (CUT1 family) n=1 Tax=Actinoplanes lutulentus TaxID=1287878 RepID=A0A327ZM34_9ACTN|nr:sn-glycerol-3-phosphate ABC transporter ATP-binding protein UgpC [Actinoplanes lutulentus]MBB2940877.1 multiple sugar transport system ATP-binding protein [Actinoplanes lutulentus]RAK43186.1 carbohydrate ABC transporter ATP-binding protein (CUT1 family) [Actinoplanes lutulentus]
MAAIEMRNIVKEYGDGFKAVNDVSLDIADGEFMILVGPSGCGKSTLLRMIVGLEDITSGDMLIGGDRVNEKAPRDRNLSMVFQNYALYPHLTVFENIAFPLRLNKKIKEEEIQTRVRDAASMLELDEHLDRKPANLSGGQRQRVAMGRAIVRRVNAFLFDEPLSNLDAKLRGQMRTEISRMQRRLGTTTVYVTHDQTEAMTLGDRVAVLRRGLLQQVASPRELYEQPVNMFVAGFIGSPPMNFMPAVVSGNRLTLPFLEADVPATAAGKVTDGQLLIAGLRPEHFEDARLLDPVKRERGVTFRAPVDVTEWLGDSQYAYIPFESNPEVAEELAKLAAELDSEALRSQLIISIDAMSRLRENHEAEFWADTGRLHLFDPRTGENLTRDEEAAADLARFEQEELRERMEQTP